MGKKLMVFGLCFFAQIVFLNVRVISYRKANNLFEKNAAPILHLAGVEITLVKVYIVTHTHIHTLVQHYYYYYYYYRQIMKARQRS